MLMQGFIAKDQFGYPMPSLANSHLYIISLSIGYSAVDDKLGKFLGCFQHCQHTINGTKVSAPRLYWLPKYIGVETNFTIGLASPLGFLDDRVSKA